MLLRHPIGERLAPPAVPVICLTRRRGGTLARPFSVFGTVPSGAPPDLCHLPQLVGTRRGCKMAQAGILYCTRAQWPGRNEIRNRILRAGTFAETYRGILRKWGSGVARLWAGTPIGAHPRRSFGFFPIAGKETRPKGRNPVSRRALRASRSTEDGRIWDPPLRGNFGPVRYGGCHSRETAPVPPEPNGAPKTP